MHQSETEPRSTQPFTAPATSYAEEEIVASSLANNEYIRQRLAPQPGDPDYLCLSDLLGAISSLAPLDANRVLDYGCGGSPYRPLFSGEVYHRADLTGGKNLDYAFAPDGMLPPQAGGYDLVLSSQVLEHVQDPGLYLSECLRVLQPGGRLLLTTHGTFWDHACPHDYWRWTTFGLHKALESAGFKTLEARKCTTGPRAALYILEQQLTTKLVGDWYTRVLSGLLWLILRLGAKRRHLAADQSLGSHKVVNVNRRDVADGHASYIGIAILAEKPT